MIKDWALLGTVLGLLAAATFAGQWLRRQDSLGLDQRTVKAFNSRVQAWWFFSVVLGLAFFQPKLTVVLFGFLSFWALREFITLTPTRAGDHRALFWVFFFFTPMQFVLVAYNFYSFYSILIPVYAFLFIAARVAISGDHHRFLERVAKIQFGLLICVYCLSFAPALLFIDCEHTDGTYGNARLLFYFITMVLFAELLQFIGSRLFGKHVIVPAVDDSRTWEGVLVGATTTAVLGLTLYWATPFTAWWQAGAMSFLIAIMASAGALTMAAIKRDRGEDASGTLIEGHGGVLNRIDAVCFAAPVFYHVTSYFFAS
ncbi:MAG TPA: phosphatidate cytidylyltransferase [Planctomycetaceae bacterium]|nr:phosphatidate cytidylyltransferase [Planctomycetaceae bacterium]